jgi:hypothetical protein
MCTYINAAVPSDADVDAVSAAIVRLKLGAGTSPGQPGSDSMILSILPQKYCHCGTPLGSVTRPHFEGDTAFERQLERHRKQGWSEARIRRWLEVKDHVQRRTEREYRELQRSGSDHWADTWCRFVREVLASGAASRIGLVVGEEENGYERPLSGQVTLPLEQLDGRQLVEMDDNVLYWFVP